MDSQQLNLWFNELEDKKRKVDDALKAGIPLKFYHPLYDVTESRRTGKDVWLPLVDPFCFTGSNRYADPYVPPGYEYIFCKIPDFTNPYASTACPPPLPKPKFPKKKCPKGKPLLSTSLPGNPDYPRK